MVFWVEDPCELFSNPSILPCPSDSKAEKLNSLSRLSFIISLALYTMESEQWLVFLLLSLLVIMIIYCSKPKDKERFTVVPTYQSNDFSQTTVSPLFAEEWQIKPPAYDLQVAVPPAESTFQTPLEPASYPYGQYLTNTNLLPSDEYYVSQGCGGQKTAREYINSAFLRHDMAHQDNMTRIYKKSLNRRFRHNTNDTYSSFNSY